VARSLACNNKRVGIRGVDGEFKSEDRDTNASFVEHIPVFLDHHLNLSTSFEVNGSAKPKVLPELWVVAICIPKVYISASRGKSHGFPSNRIAILGQYEDVVVNVVAVIKRHILVFWFWPPNL
jgi:hypothetical protein